MALSRPAGLPFMSRLLAVLLALGLAPPFFCYFIPSIDSCLVPTLTPPQPSLRPQHLYNPAKDTIVTAASCTTNCLAPVVKVVHEKLGIVHGCITTIHNLTNTQTIVDAPNTKKSDLRRARWVISMCLSGAGAQEAVGTNRLLAPPAGVQSGGWRLQGSRSRRAHHTPHIWWMGSVPQDAAIVSLAKP